MDYTLNKKIYPYDLCHTGTIKPSYLMRYMQTAAGLDTENQGASYQFLRGYNMVFVITKLKLEMFGEITAGDDISVRTWGKAVKGVTFVRDFEIKKGQDLVGYASTQWVLMNFTERFPLRPSRFPIPIPDNSAIPAREVELERHIEFPAEIEHNTFTRRVMLSDLDENQHMNNANYADIMLDYLPQSIHANSFKMIQINFCGEALLNDELEVSVASEGKTAFYKAKNLTKDQDCFEGKIVLN